ncbi:RBBP9/YdeN family alpha/beta hydrolase [Streptomyces sp. H51]|uniref:RBBP9/YdeN family alpha/beta hydrolase n=1 Tax=Streptomyces sp. H51 TaxID=3111770 RepID=UPI002D793042|nr:alpha/beta hydrolase [Streptomyces sp. H51]
MTAYLILHGWQNHRPEGHWQHWLADRLTELGHHVTYPQLPDPDDPDLEVWLTELARHLDGLEGPERVVLAHSASAVLWLHAASRGIVRPGAADRVLLVAPPSASVLARHPEIAGFAPPPPGFGLPTPTRLIAGDDDPYCPEGAREVFGEPYGIPTDILPGAGHLDMDAGYGSWPSVLAWCLDPTVPLLARPAASSS